MAVSVVVIAAFVAAEGRAVACSCAVVPPPVENAAASDAVFEGRVLETVRPAAPRPETEPSVEINFEVQRWWKGELPAAVSIWTFSVGSLCGIELDTGASYLIFARTVDGRLTTGLRARQ